MSPFSAIDYSFAKKVGQRNYQEKFTTDGRSERASERVSEWVSEIVLSSDNPFNDLKSVAWHDARAMLQERVLHVKIVRASCNNFFLAREVARKNVTFKPPVFIFLILDCRTPKSSDHSMSKIQMSEPSGNSTPTRAIKKKVTFADTAGLTLESVKTIPSYSKEDVVTMNGTMNDTNVGLHMQCLRRRLKCLSPSFVEPCKTDLFHECVSKQNVCLESISCDDLVITGVVRVKSLGYAK